MNPHPHFPPRQRPPWWPQNEEWPPTRESWRRVGRRSPFFRRMGCFFFGFAFLAFVGLLGILRLILAPFLEIPGVPPLDRTGFILPIAFLGFILLIFAVGWGARNLRRVFTPLDELFRASERVANGDYSVRVQEKGPPEVHSLTRSFNSMAERLQANDQQRRTMLADISHELRTPITVIQGNVEGMLDGIYPADETRLKSIIEETQILSRLVEDLRTLALAASGALRLRREPTNLAELIRDAVSSLEAPVKEKDIQIKMALENVEGANIDPQRIREVLTNLLSNALRYTPHGGGIKIQLTQATVEHEKNVTISLEDSGPGIEPHLLPHVFDRYYKSSDSGGMGLGLSIAKYLVEAHDGEIWVESTEGKGTTISFSFPS
jgi:two-component system OmpR family sensor kinase